MSLYFIWSYPGENVWPEKSEKNKQEGFFSWMQESRGKNKRNILDTVVGTILSEALHSQQRDWKISKYIWRATWQILRLLADVFAASWSFDPSMNPPHHLVMLLWHAPIRSQNTTNTNSHRAFSQLKKRNLAPLWSEIWPRPPRFSILACLLVNPFKLKYVYQ